MNSPVENKSSKSSTLSHFMKCALGSAAILLAIYLITLIGFKKVVWAASQVVLTPLTLMSYSWTVSLYIAGFFVLTFFCMLFTGGTTTRVYRYLFIPFIFFFSTLLGYGAMTFTQNVHPYSYSLTSKQIFSKDNQNIFELIDQLSPREHYVLSLYGNFTGEPNDIFSSSDERERSMLRNFITDSSRQKTLLVSQKNPKNLGNILEAMRYINYTDERALYPQCVRLFNQYKENHTINSFMVMKVNDETVDGTNYNACKFGNVNTVVFSWGQITFDSEKRTRPAALKTSTKAQPSIIISNTLPPLPPTSPPPIN